VLSIDGSYLEGGGQIVRSALFLSTLTGKPFHVYNIRGKRKRPGLKAQHLNVIKTLKMLSSCKVEGERLGSLELYFYPGEVRGIDAEIDIGTAGSVTLLMQTIVPTCMLAKNGSSLIIKGGTDVSGGMTLDFFRHIILFFMKRFANNLKVEHTRRGFYPKGGGIIRFTCEPSPNLFKHAEPLKLIQKGDLKSIAIYSCSSKDLLQRRVADRQLKEAKRILFQRFQVEFKEEIEYSESLSPGSSITLIADFENGVRLGSDALGERGKSAEKVAQEAVTRLTNEIESGACVDKHTADNLIIWLAIAGGVIKTSEITLHTRTNIWVCDLFFGKIFNIKDNLISCSGVKI
jgi:RNA 3'-phosphate cyclase